MKLFHITVLALVLTACGGPCDEPITVESDKYMVTDFNPPKHVSVDLKRLSDGRQFHVRFGKHCNGYSEHLYVGREVTLNRYTYTDGETDRIEFHDEELRNCFCD